MPTLSSQQKLLYAELFGTVAFLAVLLAYKAVLSANPHVFNTALIAYTVIYFGYSLLVNRRSRFKSGDYLVDERDWIIESEGVRTSYSILLAGMAYLIIWIEDTPALNATRIFSRLVVILALSSVARIVQMLRLYRGLA